MAATEDMPNMEQIKVYEKSYIMKPTSDVPGYRKFQQRDVHQANRSLRDAENQLEDTRQELEAVRERGESSRAEREEIDKIRPELNGNEVIAHLGVPPGPLVGRAIDFLLEVRLEEGLLGREEILKRLDAWWVAQQN